MKFTRRTSLPLLLLLPILLGAFACIMPAVTQSNEDAAGTAVAATLAVILRSTQDAGSGVDLLFTDTPTSLASSTFTPLPPPSTATLLSTATWTPLPTSTFTPGFPIISVSTATNCRRGPGKVYDMVGGLMVGESAPVYARDPSGQYWYIRNPDIANGFCWLWGEYATVSGPTSALPVFTPPPTPTPRPTSTPTRTPTPAPDFNLGFDALESCSGFWVDLSFHNTGNVTFESVNMTIRDTVTSKVITVISNEFTDNTGCKSVIKKPKIGPGKAVIQSSPKFGYNPNGHKLKAVVTLCSLSGLNGYCATNSIVFTP
ncbi:MAG TPA: hypothetical protein VMJ64_05665 [Anaerolineales bacterium]|nr:hypothetical protein [Anaerolineales bacterium]